MLRVKGISGIVAIWVWVRCRIRHDWRGPWPYTPPGEEKWTCMRCPHVKTVRYTVSSPEEVDRHEEIVRSIRQRSENLSTTTTNPSGEILWIEEPPPEDGPIQIYSGSPNPTPGDVFAAKVAQDAAERIDREFLGAGS